MAGVNYDNSLILLFSFFLASLFVIGILQTFSNLSGLVISAGTTQPSFAGKQSRFQIHFSKSKSKEHQSIVCYWEGFESEPKNLIQDTKIAVELLLPTSRRGLFRPGRLKLQTLYPFGLCRAWTWVDLDMHCWVYPKPIPCVIPKMACSVHSSDAVTVTREGNEDFDGLRNYQPSDSLKSVDWKAFARRGTLYTKQFHGYESQSKWVDWYAMPAADPELKLSHMCFLVLEYAKTQEVYGLKLPTTEVAPGSGELHCQRCLEALARHA